jgi:Methyltransferase domain
MTGDALRRLLDWDEAWYLDRNPDVSAACARGELPADPFLHYLWFGRSEGRFPSARAEAVAGQGERPAPLKLGDVEVPLDWPVKGEPGKTFLLRLADGFFAEFMAGPVVLDVGYRGAEGEEAVPILPHAIGVDVDYPGYDGVRLPFADGSVDTVFASHVLEHVADYAAVIRDWFRTLRVGGFIVCVVPHQFLYEKRRSLPSRWNGDHRRFYTPASLLHEFEESLAPNTYRVRHLRDNDLGYLYRLRPEQHAFGCYEIELVIEKIAAPGWPPG